MEFMNNNSSPDTVSTRNLAYVSVARTVDRQLVIVFSINWERVWNWVEPSKMIGAHHNRSHIALCTSVSCQMIPHAAWQTLTRLRSVAAVYFRRHRPILALYKAGLYGRILNETILNENGRAGVGNGIEK